jgi:hypothetical protein
MSLLVIKDTNRNLRLERSERKSNSRTITMPAEIEGSSCIEEPTAFIFRGEEGSTLKIEAPLSLKLC